MTRAKTWFENLTTLSKIEGQSTPSDGLCLVIPSECEGSKQEDFSLCSKQGFLPSVEMTRRVALRLGVVR
jgi:hypothetical protein